jgi:hypothetical protein
VSGSDTYGKRSVPTVPEMRRVREDGEDEGEPTQQRCPLCVGHGYVPPEHAIAFESYCAKLHEQQK